MAFVRQHKWPCPILCAKLKQSRDPKSNHRNTSLCHWQLWITFTLGIVIMSGIYHWKTISVNFSCVERERRKKKKKKRSHKTISVNFSCVERERREKTKKKKRRSHKLIKLNTKISYRSDGRIFTNRKFRWCSTTKLRQIVEFR